MTSTRLLSEKEHMYTINHTNCASD